MIILFANSFSTNTICKELATTIRTYADIDYLLSMAKMNQQYTTAEYQHFQTVYQSAKPYDFIIQDTFKFINYYMIIPSRYYLKELTHQPVKSTKVESTEKPLQESSKFSLFVKKEKPTIPRPSLSLNKPLGNHSFQMAHTAEPVKKPESMDVSLKMRKDIEDIILGNIRILVYGPMLDNLSSEIKSLIKKHITNIRTPFKVELARRNSDYGGAPELVLVSNGGAQINADLLILKDKITERQALDMIYRMENHLEGTIRRIENLRIQRLILL